MYGKYEETVVDANVESGDGKMRLDVGMCLATCDLGGGGVWVLAGNLLEDLEAGIGE